jgi:hypothetical protein
MDKFVQQPNLALQSSLHVACNFYDEKTQKNYRNSMICTIILGQVFEQIHRLNNLYGVSYKSVINDDKDFKDYGVLVKVENEKFSFELYAQVFQIIHKGYTDKFVMPVENPQDKLINECNFIDMYASTGIMDTLNYDVVTEPLDASWKIYYDYKKPVPAKTNFFGKLAPTKQDYNYYGKNISSMINYFYTIIKAINRVNDEVVTKGSLCSWNAVPFDNFMIAYIMLNLKMYLEKKGLLVMITSDDKCSLLVSNSIELEYDISVNKIIVKPGLTQIKMHVMIHHVHEFIILYFSKKRIFGEGFQYTNNKKK